MHMHKRIEHPKGRLSGFSLVLLAIVATLALLAAPAQAAEKHTFDPLLSLRGDCSIEPLDEVPDPGLCPGTPGIDHPPKKFTEPCGTAVDRYGDIYVSSKAQGTTLPLGKAGRIDVFNAAGEYLTEIKDEEGPCKLAVDSEGNVYAVGNSHTVRFKAKSFPPVKGSEYEGSTIDAESCNFESVAVDPSDDHLYRSCGQIFEYGSAAEGSALRGGVDEVQRLAVDASGGSFKLVYTERTAGYSGATEPGASGATADFTAGSSVVSSIVGASGTGTLTAGSTAVTSVTTALGKFRSGRPISGPGLSEATGTGDFSPGSKTVTNVSLATGTFAVGQTVFAPGVPDGTTITALAPGTLTLSDAAGGASQVGAPILATTTVAEVTRGETGQFIRLSLPAAASSGAAPLESIGLAGTNTYAFGPGVPPKAELTSLGPNQLSEGSAVVFFNLGNGDLTAGSNAVTNVLVERGTFAAGQFVAAPGVPEGTTITAVELEKEEEVNLEVKKFYKITLSAPPSVTEKGSIHSTSAAANTAASVPLTVGDFSNQSQVQETAAIPFGASSATVQAALEALPAIGPGNVSVTGGPGGSAPYLIAFQGRLANIDVPSLGAEGSELSGSAATAAITTDTDGYDGAIGRQGAASSGRAGLDRGLLEITADVAVDGKSHKIYASGTDAPFGEASIKSARAFVFDGADGHLECEIDGSEVPGGFGFGFGKAGVAVDQSNGDLYLSDVAQREVVDQFDSECHYLGQIEHSFSGGPNSPFGAGLALDAPYEGEPGYDSPNQGELYVAQGNAAAQYHLDAFAPLKPPKPAEVRAQHVASVSATEALLEAEVNPNGQPTTYHFQYISQADFEADGESYGEGSSSVPVSEASAGSDAFFKPVSASISGLDPKSAYRFRLVATNHCKEAEPEVPCTTTGEGKPGEEGEDAAFATYGPEPGTPDGRAYELVTPPDTNGLTPTAGIGNNAFSVDFTTALVSPDGQSVSFGTEGGSLPGLEGGGFHDLYTATRGPDGWQTSFAGLNGAQAAREVFPGGLAPDHRYSFWAIGAGAGGTLAEGHYLRGPGGVEPIPGAGGSLTAEGLWIGPGGDQVLYTSASGGVIYERSAAGGPPEALSILPGESTPTGGTYRGISADGGAVVFKAGDDLYVRLGGLETQRVAEASPVPDGTSGLAFAGVSAGGHRIAYLLLNHTKPRRPNPVFPENSGPRQGQIFTYDTETQQTVALGSGDEAVPVNVSPDGSHIYFLSPAALAGEQNSQGAVATPPAKGHGTLTSGSAQLSGLSAEAGAFSAGMEITGSGIPVGTTIAALDEGAATLTLSQPATASGPVQLSAVAENLYAWDSETEALAFIATLTQRDVYGAAETDALGAVTDGLGLWTGYVTGGGASPVDGPGSDPSRSSADGRVLLFESRARLTGYENAGHSEIYRYDAGAGSLECISCTATGVPASSNASLQSRPPFLLRSLPPVNDMAEVINLTPDGRRAFFQSAEPLVLGDTDGLQDVYEWEAPGKGTCAEAGAAFQAQAGGCLYLISGPHSATEDYLYGMTPDGSDVVFLSGDLLSFEDPDGTPSLYDARVQGGFQPPPPIAGECLGEACQPAAVAPNDPTPGSAGYEGAGNVIEAVPGSCPKGKVKKHGKCAKPHKEHHRGAHAHRGTHR
jgi:hypothetical protein